MSDEDADGAGDGLREGLARAGEAIVERRGQLQLTQAEVAERAGIDVSTLREIEQGVVPKRGRHRATMARLSDALEWEADQIRRIAEGEPPPWRGNAEWLTETSAQVEALTEQVTTLLAGLNRLAAQVDGLGGQVDRLSQRVDRLESLGG